MAVTWAKTGQPPAHKHRQLVGVWLPGGVFNGWSFFFLPGAEGLSAGRGHAGPARRSWCSVPVSADPRPPLLGETLDSVTRWIWLGGGATVFVSKQLAVHTSYPVPEQTGQTNEQLKDTDMNAPMTWKQSPTGRQDEPFVIRRNPQGHGKVTSSVCGARHSQDLQWTRSPPPAPRCCRDGRAPPALQYAASEGYAPLREWVAASLPGVVDPARC
jgi:hypothetical protein